MPAKDPEPTWVIVKFQFELNITPNNSLTPFCIDGPHVSESHSPSFLILADMELKVNSIGLIQKDPIPRGGVDIVFFPFAVP